jgi:hypothetical protein
VEKKGMEKRTRTYFDLHVQMPTLDPSEFQFCRQLQSASGSFFDVVMAKGSRSQ